MDEDDNPISFWKGPASDFVDPNPSYRWLIMKADKAEGYIENDYEAGMIQIKLSINDVFKNGRLDFKKFPTWAKNPPKRLHTVSKIRCFIFMCKDIPSSDNDGLSDCFISVWNQDGEKIETRTIEDSLNPVFYETKQLEYSYEHLGDAPPLILNLWDKNNIVSKDVYLGRAVIRIEDAATNEIPVDGFGETLS